MSEIKLSDYIAKRLKEKYNVETLFMVSGGGAMHLNDSFGKFIPYICNHNEQATAFSAEGYARVHQNLAVVNVTTGPGGLNCLNGVFGQYTDSVPVLYISGQVKTMTMKSTYPEIPLRQLGDQEVDIISCVKPITKYAVTLKDKNDVKYVLDKAIYIATHDRKGPVWIDVPIDIQSALIDENNLREFTLPKIQKDKIAYKEFISQFEKAKRPLIVAGHGIRLSGAIKEFDELIKKYNIPIVTTFNGFDLMTDDNRCYIGRIGTIGQRAGNFALQNADFILFLGTRNNIRQVSYNWENYAKNAYKTVVDIDEAELDKPTLKPDLKFQSDIKVFLSGLLKQNIKDNNYKNWLNFCLNLKEKYSFKNHPEKKQSDDIINPYYFTNCLTKLLKEDDVFIMANGSACVCTFQNAIVKKNQRFILNSGDASMGFGLPAAIGACVANNKKRTICLEGDGSIMMNLQELQTVAYNKLPIKIFVINNEGYSSIRQTQKRFFNGRMTASGIKSGVSVPDFVKIAKAFNIKSFKIKNPKTMEKNILKALNFNGAVLIEVMVEKEYDFLPKLSSKILEDGTMVSPSLEDMYPFLAQEELKRSMINNEIL